MKKSLILVLITALCIGMLSTLSGCYITSSGKISDIEGTYKLTKSSYDYQDMIAEKEIVEYLVVNGQGLGYRYYMDNTLKSPLCLQVKNEFIEDEDNKGTYNHVSFTLREHDDYDNDAVLKLGYNKDSNILITATPAINGDLIHTKEKNITYTKISDDVTLRTVEKELNEKLFAVPYEFNAYDFVISSSECYVEDETGTCINHEYYYYIMDFDFKNNTVDIYYAMKKTKEQFEKEGIPFTSKIDDAGVRIFEIEGEVYKESGKGRFTKAKEIDGKQYSIDFYATSERNPQNYIDGMMK